MKTFFLRMIDLYRTFARFFLPSSCRFYPSCSQYTKEAIESYGPLKGCWMGLQRVLRCHPFNTGGFDPVE